MINDRQTENAADSSQSGFALVSVLGLFLLTSFILFAFLESSRLRSVTSATEYQSFRYRLMSEAIFQVIADRIVDGTYSAGGEPAETWQACRIGDYLFLLRVTDHAGLVDLNTADQKLLEHGFVALGLEAGKARILAQAATEYRQINPLEQTLSESVIGPLGLKHAPFEDILELRDFPDVKPFTQHEIARVFTVDSRGATIFPGKSPLALRAAINNNSEMIGPTSSRYGTALTLDIEIQRSDRLSYASSVVFLMFDDDAQMKNLPAEVDGASRSATVPSSSACKELFGDPATEMLREVLQ